MRSFCKTPSIAFLVSVAALVFSPVAATAGLTPQQKCQSTIGKATGKFIQSVSKARQKCQDALLNGKVSSCPDTKETSALAKAEAKKVSAICKACGGADKVCGGGDDLTPGEIGWPAVCPGFDGQCTATISTLDDIVTCLDCINAKAANELIDDVFGGLQPAGGDKALLKCQRTIGKNVFKFFQTKSKSLQKCWDGRIKGKHTAACPSPGDGKAQAKIDGAIAKMKKAVCKACGGGNKLCGGGDDIAPSAIGITSCPPVGQCGAFPVTSVQELADCLECVAEFKVDCVDELQTPQFPEQVYDPLCAGIVCGDGLISPPIETCDGTNATGCTQSCRGSGVDECTCCGDGVVQASSNETCDGGPGCRNDCTSCGDGVLDPGEACDDGNTVDGDCCSSTCQFETVGSGCADDGEGCTDDICDGAGTCTHPNNTASCDDGVFCNGSDTCAGGTCSVHAGDPCAGGAECNVTCNESGPNCFDPSGTACADEGNECTNDQCDGAGVCAHPAKPDNTPCTDDGVFCNGVESCQSGNCASPGDPCPGTECKTCQESPPSCFDPAGTGCTDEGNLCTDDQCDGAGLCDHTAKPDSTPCDDGLFCTGTETCLGGVCLSSGDPCPGTQCNSCQESPPSCFDPSGTVCDDGDICTNPDQCDGAGSCTGVSSCGDGIVQSLCGEVCDPPGATTCPGQPGEDPTICDSSCQCPCPTVVSFEADPNGKSLDTGWTGQSHDNQVISDGILTVSIGNCSSSVRPCGQCDITTGPISNREKANNQRCTNNTSVECTSDTPCFRQCVGGASDGSACVDSSNCGGSTCAGPGTCEFYFGSFLPLSSGGVPVCVTNKVSGAITGTVNVETGGSDNTTSLNSGVFNGILVDQPCPTCDGDGTPADGIRSGTCNGGDRNGKSCDAGGQSGFFGDTSFDCPPLAGAGIGVLDLLLKSTTGTAEADITAASPNCTADTFETLKCMCDTCDTINAEPCFTDADCPSGATCGGPRCLLGPDEGTPCSLSLGCPSGSCNSSGICVGGARAGLACECRLSDCGRPGEPTKPNACSSGPTFCVAKPSDTDTIDEGECNGGPLDTVCFSEPFRSCTTNADCPFVCTSKKRECYTVDGTTTGDIDVLARGVADPPSDDVSNPRLVSLFCIPPTSRPAVNSVAGLPGLGRLTLDGTAKGF